MRIVMLCWAQWMALAAALTAQSTAITNVSVVDIETGRLLPAQTVVVTGNRISAMGPASRQGLFKAAEALAARPPS